MSSFGSQMRKRLAELRKAGEDVPKIIDEVAHDATVEAINVAEQNTPPNVGGIKGTGTRTGAMQKHWKIDSVTSPINGQTVLGNAMQYASYVNDGHRMDKHFVPHLFVNGGLIERLDSYDGGLIVGTKTTYVRGYYMKEKAIGAYRALVRKELEKRVKEAFK